MKFTFIENLRESGVIDLTCDCGAHFGREDGTGGAIEKAFDHIVECHTDESQSDDLVLAIAGKLLSPNPILLEEGDQCQPGI